jgi:hypothetical protein
MAGQDVEDEPPACPCPPFGYFSLGGVHCGGKAGTRKGRGGLAAGPVPPAAAGGYRALPRGHSVPASITIPLPSRFAVSPAGVVGGAR